MSASVSPVSPPPMPPSTAVEGFLDRGTHQALLDWTLANAERFSPATVNRPDGTRVDPTARVNLKLSDLGPAKAAVSHQLLAALPRLSETLGFSFPGQVMLELELTAYGDGAFYQAHTDTGLPGMGETRAIDPEPRLLSAVYYFHRQPKAFDGGALRLYRFGEIDTGNPANFRDFEPADNRLVAFLSWARHEVRPVRCPSGRFEDFRFALNCWYRTSLPA